MITSKNKGHYLINYPIWAEAIERYEQFHYDNKILVCYEDLIKNPSLVQHKLSKIFDLKITSDFNNFHNNVTQTHEDIKSLGGIRPIDPKNSGKYMRAEHLVRIKEQLKKHPEMSEQLVKYGYEKGREWEKYFLSENTK